MDTTVSLWSVGQRTRHDTAVFHNSHRFVQRAQVLPRIGGQYYQVSNLPYRDGADNAAQTQRIRCNACRCSPA